MKLWQFKGLKIRKSVVVSWLVSYILILAIPITASIFVFFHAESIISEKINRMNMVLLSQLKQSTDGMFAEIESIGAQIALAQNVQAAMYIKQPLKEEHHFTFMMLFNELKMLKISANYSDEFYLKLDNSGYVLTSSSIYDPELSADMLEKHHSIGADQWKALEDGSVKKGFAIVRRNLDGAEKNDVAYILQLPLGTIEEKMGTVVVFPNRKRLEAAVRSMNWNESSATLIIDESNRIIFSSGKEVADSLHFSEMPGNSDTKIVTLDGVKVVLSYTTSEILNCKYVLLEPYDTFFSQLMNFKLISLGGVLICLILGVLASYYFTRRNYSPVSELLHLVSKRLGMQIGDAGNEFRFLGSAIKRAVEVKELADKELEANHKMIRQAYLTDLLRGKTVEEAQESRLESTRLKRFFQWDNYAVLLIKIESCEGLFGDAPKYTAGHKKGLVNFIVVNCLEEIVNRQNEGHAVEMDELLAAVVCLRDDGPQALKAFVLQAARELQSFLNRDVKIELTIAVSSIHKGKRKIAECYNEARQAMEHRIVMGSNQIIDFDAIRDNDLNYKYTMDTEQDLINSIKGGDFEKAKRVLEEIFEQNFKQGTLSAQLAKCLMFDLVGTMIKTLDSISIENQFLVELNPVERLVKSDTLLEMRRQMEYILKKVCRYVEEKKNHANVLLCEKIMLFIEQHYMDMGLSVGTLAESFNVSTAHISRIFKESSGRSLLDYINRVRILRSKQLLQELERTVEEIAGLVGYGSAHTFIRIFKKYEGITPGRHRELILEKAAKENKECLST